MFIPDDKLLQWYKGVNPNRKGQWMVNLIPTAGKLSLQVSGHQKFDVTDFVNRYDFISKTIPPPTAQPLISKSRVSASLEDVTRAIMDSPSITGDSLHDRMCDIVFQIGKWMGYVPAKGYKIQPDSPYEIDVVWLNRDLLEVAVEIQIGGNETEAKDRLIHANRFGARKIVVVSSPESINRFKSLCRYEPVLKNWLEIWSIPRVYDMYVSGEKFFGSYSLFERRQWADDVREVL